VPHLLVRSVVGGIMLMAQTHTSTSIGEPTRSPVHASREHPLGVHDTRVPHTRKALPPEAQQCRTHKSGGVKACRTTQPRVRTPKPHVLPKEVAFALFLAAASHQYK
jgi:hypothetical protein